MVKISGWESKTLGTLINEGKIVIQTGPFGTVLSAKEFVKYGIPVVAVREIREGYIQIFDETPCVSMETYKRLSKYNLATNDLVFARKGNVERSALIPLTKTKYFLGSDGICLRVITKNLLPQYLFYAIQSNTVRSFLIQNAYGTTMAGLNEKILSSIPLFLPVDIDEQSAIAETFSDIDRLISSLQKLIEKKKAIKQGAMQELLTGKKRLPGFSKEWAYRRVGEICSITKGQIITEKTAIHGNVPVIAGGKTPAFYHNVANRESDVITISASGANAGYIAYHDYPIFASDCSTIESSDQYDVKFIYYALLYHQQELIGMQTGGAQPHIHPKEIGVLLVPRINQEEQRAIANVLSDMDSEIEQLEKKLAKYQQIKQGMMQELLTGRIRLKEGENNA